MFTKFVQFGGPVVSDKSRTGTIVIAEIGVNHNGSIDLAKELIQHAHAAVFTPPQLRFFCGSPGGGGEVLSMAGRQV